MKAEDFFLILQIVVTVATYAGVPIVILGSIWLVRRRRRAIERGDGLGAIAAAVHGEVATDPTFQTPFVRFTAGGIRTYCFQWLLGSASPYTITSLECGAAFQTFLEFVSYNSKRYPSRARRLRETTGLLDFRVTTTDVEWTNEILAAGLQQILHDLREWTHKPARLQLGPSRFLLEIESMLGPQEVATLAGFLSRVAALAKIRPGSSGVVFVGETRFPDEGRCAVCGQTLADPRVSCAVCRSPQHEECWQYAGRCAIFGCGGRSIA